MRTKLSWVVSSSPQQIPSPVKAVNLIEIFYFLFSVEIVLSVEQLRN